MQAHRSLDGCWWNTNGSLPVACDMQRDKCLGWSMRRSNAGDNLNGKGGCNGSMAHLLMGQAGETGG